MGKAQTRDDKHEMVPTPTTYTGSDRGTSTDQSASLMDRVEGGFKDARDQAEKKIEKATTYIREQDAQTMIRDLRKVVVRNPITSAFVGLGIGYFIGRALRR